jgi:hypothetical protein
MVGKRDLSRRRDDCATDRVVWRGPGATRGFADALVVPGTKAKTAT